MAASTSAADPAVTVDDACVEAFHRDGAAVLRGVFGEWVERLRAAVEENLAAPGPHVRRYTPDGAPGRFLGDYCNWDRIPGYRAFVTGSPAAAIAARLTGACSVRIFHEHVLVKEPGTAERTPWHHDGPYYCVEGGPNVSLWMPLDPVAREVCVEFVAGSHRWGRRFRPQRFTGAEWDRDDDGLEPIPDLDAERDRHEFLSWALEPGDAIAFDFLTVHGAPANPHPSRRRRAVSTRWLGEGARYAARAGPTSPPYPELAARLADGDPLPADVFPVCWPRRGAARGRPASPA